MRLRDLRSSSLVYNVELSISSALNIFRYIYYGVQPEIFDLLLNLIFFVTRNCGLCRSEKSEARDLYKGL